MNRRIDFHLAVIGLFVSALFLTVPAFTQETRATLSGTITDPSGAAVAAANVQLLNVQTGVNSRTESNQAGQYRFLYVNPGNYKLTMKLSGFRTVVREGIGSSPTFGGSYDPMGRPMFRDRSSWLCGSLSNR